MGNYKVGSLFAGVGGICHAFKQENCDVIWANELDQSACVTYKLNNNTTKLLEKDVRNISTETLPDVDIVAAGFPCQPFSLAGNGKGFDDARGLLFFQASRLIGELKPKAYLLENVKTLTTHNKGKTFQRIQQEILKLGYSFIPFVLNAAEYTEIPQGRERIYIVGFRDEGHYFYDFPTKENRNNNNFASLSASFKIPEKTNGTLKDIKSFLVENEVEESDIYNNDENHIHQKLQKIVKNPDTFYQYRRYYVRENKSKVCPTLTANMGAGGHNVPIILDKKYPRRLTPKECFNLQGFPKEFKLPPISKGQLYKQAGNSVVVPMVRKIVREIVRVLDENRTSSA
jgi:DNA (cytosine-5)-methyltransferase 1